MYIKNLKIKSPTSGKEYTVNGVAEMTPQMGLQMKISKIHPNNASKIILESYISNVILENHLKKQK